MYDLLIASLGILVLSAAFVFVTAAAALLHERER